jgi:hypothetical protein
VLRDHSRAPLKPVLSLCLDSMALAGKVDSLSSRSNRAGIDAHPLPPARE